MAKLFVFYSVAVVVIIIPGKIISRQNYFDDNPKRDVFIASSTGLAREGFLADTGRQ